MLREEYDLANRSGQLSGIVRREHGLRLSNLAHHREDVFAGLGCLGFLELGLCDHPHQLGMRDVRALGASIEECPVARQQSAPQLPFGLANRPPEVVIELHRQVSNALGGQICCHIDLLAAHDTHVDHGLARFGEESEVGRG